jgi:hydroxyacylglutathione hydrolase
MPGKLDYTVLTLGELQTNCYIAWCSVTREAVVIDPADSGDVISEFILEHQLNPTAILLTHGHFDHCLGLLELMLNFPVPVYLHPADQFLIQQAHESAEHWLEHTVDPVPMPDSELQNGAVITLGNCSLKVIGTPGHTPGSVCLHYKGEAQQTYNEENLYTKNDILFTGDTLFKEGITRTDFRYSNILQLHNSLHMLKKLPSSTHVLAGHGEPVELQEALAILP